MVLFIVKPPAKHSNLILVYLNKNDEILFFHVFKNSATTFLDFYCILLLTFNSLSLPDFNDGWMDGWI